MFANALKTVYECLIRLWSSLKKPPSVDTVVAERLDEIPDAQVPRIKRRLQEHRERQDQEAETKGQPSHGT
jgi:hypothetical protein